MEESEIRAQLNRLIEGVRQCFQLPVKFPITLTDTIFDDWKNPDGRLRYTSSTPILPPSFPNQVLFSQLSLDQRQRLGVLVEESKRFPLFQKPVGEYHDLEEDSSFPLAFRDAVFIFLSSLSTLAPANLKRISPIDVSSASKKDGFKEEVMNLEKKLEAFESEEEEDWIRKDLLNDSFSSLNPEKLFTFTPNIECKENQPYEKLRLWDFITLHGVMSGTEQDVLMSETNDWNQRDLDLKEFNKLPTLNPLLSGSIVSGDGLCEVSLDLEDNNCSFRSTMDVQRDHKNLISKEAFEQQLILLIQLALDGNIPAIESLDTASSVQKARALHKLLTKVIKVGYLRHDLDLMLSKFQKESKDPIQAAFIEAVACVLRWHSAVLQDLNKFVCADQSIIPDRQKPVRNISVIEAVLHTEKIRNQTCFLASFCGVHCSDHKSPLLDGNELLSQLFTELLEADNESSPMIRFLFCSTFQPFHQEMRKWLYSTDPVVSLKFTQLPVFLESVKDVFLEAGQQIRILDQLETELKVEKAIVSSVKEISKSELSELCKICAELNDEWALCGTSFGNLGFTLWESLGEDLVPLPFKQDALHELIETLHQASVTRHQEIQHLLRSARRVRKLDAEISNARILEHYRRRMCRIENQRQRDLAHTLHHDKKMEGVRIQQIRNIEKANLEIEMEMRSEMDIDQEDPNKITLEEDQEISKAAARARWDPPDSSIGAEAEIRSQMALSADEQGLEKDGELLDQLSNEEVMVPVSAVVDSCVLQPIIDQHRSISFAFSVVFCEELKFLDVVSSLKKFYFSESADWIASLVHQIFSRFVQGETLTNHLLNDALEGAFLESAYHPLVDEKHKLNLSLVLGNPNEDPQYDPGSLHWADALLLNAELEWPMSLVVDENLLEEYNLIFQMLVKVHQTRWWLTQIWSTLHKHKNKRAPLDVQFRPEFRKLRLWYQDALNIVTTLQSYMHHELHLTHWQDFMNKMHQSGLSLIKIKAIQQDYLNRALETCFLTNHTRRLRSMAESSLQSIIKFCCLLKDPLSIFQDVECWREIEKCFLELRHRSTAFYKTLKYRANRGECTEALVVLMTFNTYYGPVN